MDIYPDMDVLGGSLRISSEGYLHIFYRYMYTNLTSSIFKLKVVLLDCLVLYTCLTKSITIFLVILSPVSVTLRVNGFDG